MCVCVCARECVCVCLYVGPYVYERASLLSQRAWTSVIRLSDKSQKNVVINTLRKRKEKYLIALLFLLYPDTLRGG